MPYMTTVVNDRFELWQEMNDFCIAQGITVHELNLDAGNSGGVIFAFPESGVDPIVPEHVFRFTYDNHRPSARGFGYGCGDSWDGSNVTNYSGSRGHMDNYGGTCNHAIVYPCDVVLLYHPGQHFIIGLRNQTDFSSCIYGFGIADGVSLFDGERQPWCEGAHSGHNGERAGWFFQPSNGVYDQFVDSYVRLCGCVRLPVIPERDEQIVHWSSFANNDSRDVSFSILGQCHGNITTNFQGPYTALLDRMKFLPSLTSVMMPALTYSNITTSGLKRTVPSYSFGGMYAVNAIFLGWGQEIDLNGDSFLCLYNGIKTDDVGGFLFQY